MQLMELCDKKGSPVAGPAMCVNVATIAPGMGDGIWQCVSDQEAAPHGQPTNSRTGQIIKHQMETGGYVKRSDSEAEPVMY